MGRGVALKLVWCARLPGLCMAVLAMLTCVAPDRAAAIPFGSQEQEHDFAARKGPRDAFDSIGRIECKDPASSRHWVNATGWLIGDSQTIITAAHVFYRGGDAARKRASRPLDPRSCVFLLFDREQKTHGSFAIVQAVSPWADRRKRDDVSYDFAIARLDRPVIGAVVSLARPARDFAGATGLYALRSGRDEARMLHESKGVIERFAHDHERLAVVRRFGLRISHPHLLLLTSANSMQGSSGGMYYASGSRAAIGIHLGHLCASYRGAGSFNALDCFNYGRFISSGVLRLVEAVKAGRPHRAYLIRADGD
jgi:hypothetical protein